MYSYIIAAMILITYGLGNAHAGDGFQGFYWQTKAWDHSWNKVIAPDPVRAGVSAQRFEVRPGDCGPDPHYAAYDDCMQDRERAELVSSRQLHMGEEHWIAFSVYVPNDFVNPQPVRTVLMQIGQASGMDGQGIHRPLLQFNVLGDQFVMTYHDLRGAIDAPVDIDRNTIICSLGTMRGRWIDIMLHIRFGVEDGFATVYQNGRLRGGVRRDMVKWPVHHFFVKYGIYRPFISQYQNSTKRSMPTQVIFFDELKIGNTRQDVELGNGNIID